MTFEDVVHPNGGRVGGDGRPRAWLDGTSKVRSRLAVVRSLGVPLLAVVAIAVASWVSRLVDLRVTGASSLAFRTLWWVLLAFNVGDAFEQRRRAEAWTSLLLKYVMVGVTYSILV